jgi:predicted N-acetyltransferase YhbS
MTGQMNIRVLRHEEAETVARLRASAFFAGSERTVEQDAAELTLLIGDGYEIALVAELGGEAVGTVLLVRRELDLACDYSPWLAGLLVAPEHRGRGIGSRLVAEVEEHARSIGCEQLYLYTHGAEAFYSALGWTVAERFLQHGEQAVLMLRDLRSHMVFCED